MCYSRSYTSGIKKSFGLIFFFCVSACERAQQKWKENTSQLPRGIVAMSSNHRFQAFRGSVKVASGKDSVFEWTWVSLLVYKYGVMFGFDHDCQRCSWVVSIPDNLVLRLKSFWQTFFFQFGGYCDNFHTTDTIALWCRLPAVIPKWCQIVHRCFNLTRQC